MHTRSQTDANLRLRLSEKYGMACATGAMNSQQQVALVLAMTDEYTRFVPYVGPGSVWMVWDKVRREAAPGKYADEIQATETAEREDLKWGRHGARVPS